MSLRRFGERILSGLGLPSWAAPRDPSWFSWERKKLGQELDTDLNSYSRYKTLEMAAKGAESPDS